MSVLIAKVQSKRFIAITSAFGSSSPLLEPLPLPRLKAENAAIKTKSAALLDVFEKWHRFEKKIEELEKRIEELEYRIEELENSPPPSDADDDGSENGDYSDFSDWLECAGEGCEKILCGKNTVFAPAVHDKGRDYCRPCEAKLPDYVQNGLKQWKANELIDERLAGDY